MTSGAWDLPGLARVDAVVTGYVERGDVPGAAWLVARRGDVHTGTAGCLAVDGGGPIERDAIFRIASMTKPITAVAALTMVEDGRLGLDEPVDELLPELADRRVLVHPEGPLDATVPADRPITLRDLLTFRLGLGFDFGNFDGQALVPALAGLDLGVGPPAPATVPAPDEWMRRIGTLPLERQPGERWLYHFGAEVLGVLVARAAGRPLGDVLGDRIFLPLGMVDTGFSVTPEQQRRLTSSYEADADTGARRLYDGPDGQWSTPPAFPSGGGGLVSTLDDFRAFAAMLLAGGSYPGGRILSEATVAAMTTNQLTPEQLASGPDPSGAAGWGFGVGVQVRQDGIGPAAGAYGWTGGLGSTWTNDPAEDLVAILLTNQAFTSAGLPAVCADFETALYTALT